MNIIILFIIFFSCSILHAGDINPSQKNPDVGKSFHLMTDQSFSSDELIKVRFELESGFSYFSEESEEQLDQKKELVEADIRLYRVPQPIEFLKKQENLHRPDWKPNYKGEGIYNALRYIWDSWYKKARLAWQRIFSPESRKKVIAAHPQLSQQPAHTYQSEQKKALQFKPIEGLELLNTFRYPIDLSKPYNPNPDLVLEGSSSNYMSPVKKGNIQIPIDQQKPGLYLVEAMIGQQRATTFVFVSDMVVVSKMAHQQGMIWTANRKTGENKAKSKILFSDGVGIIDQGQTDEDGVFIATKNVPEHSFVIAEDDQGGIAISENFFYGMNQTQPKVYVFTDRPLYQPGDVVKVKAFAQVSYKNVNTAQFTVYESNGQQLLTKTVPWDFQNGADSEFLLPDFVAVGGYQIVLTVNEEKYTAAFRVSMYTKPHLEAQIILSKPTFKINENIAGHIQLLYPNGQAVVDAEVSLQIRSEQMSMFEGSVSYVAGSPVELSQKVFRSNKQGIVEFAVPAATKPSRFLITAKIFDQAAYSVTAKKEILIEGFKEMFTLTSSKNSSEANQEVKFSYQLKSQEQNTIALKSWQAIRLEDQTMQDGEIKNSEKGDVSITFKTTGHYQVNLIDEQGIIRGSISHTVVGADLKNLTASVEIITDQKAYQVGETANVILNFKEEVSNALITLEREKIAHHATFSNEKQWVKAIKVNEKQWKIAIPILKEYAPNMTFSVAFLKDGIFTFENKGLLVRKSEIDITFKPTKMVYAPHEKVEVEISTVFDGKPISALLAASVVDEMIYTIQPEVAPPIVDFFYHWQRNQVRTTSSMAFYSYNPSLSPVEKPSSSPAYRSLKMMQERARRDNKDTAYWNAQLKTDANGKAKIEFTMPDAITRWRMTARAIAFDQSQNFEVGEGKSYISSHQDFYIKWSNPTQFRIGDKAKPTVVVFNSSDKKADLTIHFSGEGFESKQNIVANAGINTVEVEELPKRSGDLLITLKQGEKTIDRLQTQLQFFEENWTNFHSQIFSLDVAAQLNLPVDASDIKLKLIPESSYQYQKIADDMMEYPWGCVEQTASRLIPLVIAAQSIGSVKDSSEPMLAKLALMIESETRRLADMYHVDSRYSWWGHQTFEDPLITAHAIHAKARVEKYLNNQELVREDRDLLLQMFANYENMSLLEKTYLLWVLDYIGEPMTEQLNGVLKQVSNNLSSSPSSTLSERDSYFFATKDESNDLALVILAALAAKKKLTVSAQWNERLALILKSSVNHPMILAAIYYYQYHIPNSGVAAINLENILQSIKLESPTIDRAVALALVDEVSPALGKFKKNAVPEMIDQWKLIAKKDFTYTWTGKNKPDILPVVAGARAEISYQSKEDLKSTLEIEISRKLYRVEFSPTPQESNKDVSVDEFNLIEHKLIEVGAKESLDSKAVYVDEVVVKPKRSGAKFLLIEVPLPAGSDIYEKASGLNFKDFDENFVEPRYAHHGLGYGIPIQELNKTEEKSNELKFHQMVRFQLPGVFKLPRVRIFKMYQPNERAYEKGELREILVR